MRPVRHLVKQYSCLHSPRRPGDLLLRNCLHRRDRVIILQIPCRLQSHGPLRIFPCRKSLEGAVRKKTLLQFLRRALLLQLLNYDILFNLPCIEHFRQVPDAVAHIELIISLLNDPGRLPDLSKIVVGGQHPNRERHIDRLGHSASQHACLGK